MHALFTFLGHEIPAPTLESLTAALQHRVRPFGWDVECLAPDLAVPCAEFARRDGAVRLRVQRAGTGWSVEVEHLRDAVVRGYGNGPECSVRLAEGQILRLGGRSVFPLAEAFGLAVQILEENPPPQLLASPSAVLLGSL